MLPMPLKSRIFSFKNKKIYWRFFVLLAGRRMVRTSSGHHRYKTANLYKITERIPKKMRRFFRGGCKCPNAKMESQNYLLSFCAGVQEGLLQAYHEQCRSTVIVKTRPIKDIVLYILRDDAVFTSSETQDEALVRAGLIFFQAEAGM